MSINTSLFRQSVARYRARLSKLARGELDHQRRPKVVTSSRTQPVVQESDIVKRLAIYGRRRQNSVARAMALLIVLRDHENLTVPAPANSTFAQRAHRPVTVTHSGAKWQAFTGTHNDPACHSCPALLELNGQLPTYMTDNMGLRRHLIAVFADCMMMPGWVNDADGVIDSAAGKLAFAHAGARVINDAGTTWQQGVRIYIEDMRDILGGAFEVLFNSGQDHVQLRDPESAQQLEAVIAFYEGLFLTPIPENQVRNMIAEVHLEMALGH